MMMMMIMMMMIMIMIMIMITRAQLRVRTRKSSRRLKGSKFLVKTSRRQGLLVKYVAQFFALPPLQFL